MNKNLVFVRAGQHSLHSGWFAQDSVRQWDCCVSWYNKPELEKLADYYHEGGINKFDAFYDWYSSTENARHYDYYLIIDDDIKFKQGTLNGFFNLCNAYQIYLTQPSLSLGTFANHDVTLNNPYTLLRIVSFIEVMAPCFSNQALQQLMPTFQLTKSTWGLDYIWAAMLQDTNNISIIDAVQILHTKPVETNTGAFYQYMKHIGVDPSDEYFKVKQSYSSFNGMRTKPKGRHLLKAHFLPNFLSYPLVRLGEHYKKRKHLGLLKST